MSNEQDSPLSLDEIREMAGDSQRIVRWATQLLDALRSPDEELRAWVADALAGIEGLPAEQCQSIAGYCRDEEAVVASWACKLLAKAADPAPATEEALSTALDSHPNTGVRQQAVLALSRRSALRDSSLAALKTASLHEDARLARLATTALEALAQDANAVRTHD